MKRFWLATVAIIALSGGSALAADMPVKAAPIVCPACNWSGFYIGGNVGGSIGHDATTDAISLIPPGANAAGVTNPISSTAYPQSLSGFVGGGQAGFNWQVGKFVVGAEADWDWSGQRDNLLVQNWISSTVVVAPSRYVLTDEHKLNWLATVRARLGWANGYSLWYVTGGAAWGGLQSNYTFVDGGSNVFATAPASASFGTSTKSGWTVGGGVETSLAWMGANHWSVKMEYLYVDLGNRLDSFTVPVARGGAAYTISSSTAIRDHIVRLGLNYRFGGDKFAPQPPTPGPCPTCNWQGFYVGVNAGGIVGQDRSRDIDSFIPPGGNAGVINPLTDVAHTQSGVGGLVGGQAGYNWQIGKVVVGAEGDLDWSSKHDTFSNVNFYGSTVFVAGTQNQIYTDQKMDWLATLRARIGWTENCFLWYVTGGAAWAKVDSSYAFQAVPGVAGGFTLFGTAPFAANTSTTKSGWTVGGGVETSLAWLGASDRWSAKMEYLYVDLGTVANAFVTPANGIPLVAAVHNYTSYDTIHDHIIRVGLNYRFAGPVVAKY